MIVSFLVSIKTQKLWWTVIRPTESRNFSTWGKRLNTRVKKKRKKYRRKNLRRHFFPSYSEWVILYESGKSHVVQGQIPGSLRWITTTNRWLWLRFIFDFFTYNVTDNLNSSNSFWHQKHYGTVRCQTDDGGVRHIIEIGSKSLRKV